MHETNGVDDSPADNWDSVSPDTGERPTSRLKPKEEFQDWKDYVEFLTLPRGRDSANPSSLDGAEDKPRDPFSASSLLKSAFGVFLFLLVLATLIALLVAKLAADLRPPIHYVERRLSSGADTAFEEDLAQTQAVADSIAGSDPIRSASFNLEYSDVLAMMGIFAAFSIALSVSYSSALRSANREVDDFTRDSGSGPGAATLSESVMRHLHRMSLIIFAEALVLVSAIAVSIAYVFSEHAHQVLLNTPAAQLAGTVETLGWLPFIREAGLAHPRNAMLLAFIILLYLFSIIDLTGFEGAQFKTATLLVEERYKQYFKKKVDQEGDARFSAVDTGEYAAGSMKWWQKLFIPVTVSGAICATGATLLLLYLLLVIEQFVHAPNSVDWTPFEQATISLLALNLFGVALTFAVLGFIDRWRLFAGVTRPPAFTLGYICLPFILFYWALLAVLWGSDVPCGWVYLLPGPLVGLAWAQHMGFAGLCKCQSRRARSNKATADLYQLWRAWESADSAIRQAD